MTRLIGLNRIAAITVALGWLFAGAQEAGRTATPADLQWPGSFYTEPANVPHFVLSKGEPVVVQISGTGPTATRLADTAQAPK